MADSGCDSLDHAVPRLAAAVLAALVALAVPVLATAQPTQLFPRVTYEKTVQFTRNGPVVLHVVRGPRPAGLYRLRPVLSNDSVLGRETVSGMEKRLAAQATSVGVNGDFFTAASGRPSGILLRDGILATPPNSGRSSAGIALDGSLDIRKIRFLGTWRGGGQRRPLNSLNDLPGANGISLFTSDWGAATPAIPGSYAVVVSPFTGATPNADLTGTVTAAAPRGPVSIAPGTAVLVARGTAGAKLQAEAPVGATVTLRLILQPAWSTVSDAIGGGPVLVRHGKPIYRADEAFSTAQLAPRAPRSAIGQTASGDVLLVTTDGRQPGYSVGMTNFDLAQALVRLGAVQAMALDSGGSSTLAFDGAVLNSPSDGRERAVSTALMLQYYGVYEPAPLESVVSPNGDGVADGQKLSFKVVRPSTVTVTLTGPAGVVSQETAARQPGTYDVAFPPQPAAQPGQQPTLPASAADGRWTLAVSATDDQGLASTATQRFAVNSTIGFLRVTPSRLVLRPAGGSSPISWTQTRSARVKVTIETQQGIVLRTVLAATLPAGEQSASWDGRTQRGKLVGTGRYVVRVAATNELGSVSLTQFLTVRRVASGG
jgi:hypothetical protein